MILVQFGVDKHYYIFQRQKNCARLHQITREMILFLINKLLEKNITESQNRRNFDGSRVLFVICTPVSTLHSCYMKNALVFSLL